MRGTVAVMVLASACCFGDVASAHVTGPSYEVREDGYLIDVGYEDARVGQSVRLDFSLFNEASSTTDEADYSDVWVNISEGPKVLFAGDIHRPPFGKTGMTFVPAVAGDYTVSVRFQKGVDSVVASKFSLPVAGVLSSFPTKVIWGALLPVFFLGAAIIIFLVRKKRGSGKTVA